MRAYTRFNIPTVALLLHIYRWCYKLTGAANHIRLAYTDLRWWSFITRAISRLTLNYYKHFYRLQANIVESIIDWTQKIKERWAWIFYLNEEIAYIFITQPTANYFSTLWYDFKTLTWLCENNLSNRPNILPTINRILWW